MPTSGEIRGRLKLVKSFGGDDSPCDFHKALDRELNPLGAIQRLCIVIALGAQEGDVDASLGLVRPSSAARKQVLIAFCAPGIRSQARAFALEPEPTRTAVTQTLEDVATDISRQLRSVYRALDLGIAQRRLPQVV